MQLSRNFLMFGFAAVVLWYAYQTAGYERLRESISGESRTRDEKTPQAKVERCLAAAAKAEGARQVYVREKAAYQSFTNKLLREPVPSSTRVPDSVFVRAFKWLVVEPISDQDLRAHHEHVLETTQRCRELAGALRATSEFENTLMTLQGRSPDYDRNLQAMKSSRAEIELIIKYRDEGFPDTLQGRVKREEVISLVYHATRTMLQP